MKISNFAVVFLLLFVFCQDISEPEPPIFLDNASVRMDYVQGVNPAEYFDLYIGQSKSLDSISVSFYKRYDADSLLSSFPTETVSFDSVIAFDTSAVYIRVCIDAISLDSLKSTACITKKISALF